MKILIETKIHGTKEVLFDDDDYDLIKDFVWHIQYDHGNFYVRCNIWVKGVRKSPKMHRIIMGVSNKPRPHIDHINENGLDNRRSNLRMATIAENARNTGPNSRSVTGYKGVSLYTVGPQSGQYAVRLRFNGKSYFGGYFNDVIDAAKKYNELSLKYHGEFAYQNKFRGNKKNIDTHKVVAVPRKWKPKSKTGFYGVSTHYYKSNKRYSATVYVDKKAKCIGYFKTPIEAAKAYDEKSKELFGKNAVLNFK